MSSSFESTESSEAIDFDNFHSNVLPELMASGNSRLAAAAVGRGSLAFRVDGAAYTYTRCEDSIEIAPGDEAADVVIELSLDHWSSMVRETMTAPGLLYGDTMHAAPTPEANDRASYRISAVTGYAKPDSHVPKAKGGYNSVLHQSADGQIEHLSKVTGRLSTKD